MDDLELAKAPYNPFCFACSASRLNTPLAEPYWPPKKLEDTIGGRIDDDSATLTEWVEKDPIPQLDGQVDHLGATNPVAVRGYWCCIIKLRHLFSADRARAIFAAVYKQVLPAGYVYARNCDGPEPQPW
jgi:hypothetical protein